MNQNELTRVGHPMRQFGGSQRENIELFALFVMCSVVTDISKLCCLVVTVISVDTLLSTQLVNVRIEMYQQSSLLSNIIITSGRFCDVSDVIVTGASQRWLLPHQVDGK